MATVPVTQVKLGDKLVEDVLTPLGSVLFHKGRVVTPRELDILQAFLVPTVVIDAPDRPQDKEAASLAEEIKPVIETKSELGAQYILMVKLLKKVYNQTISGQSIPVLELRTQLEALLGYMDEYKVLQFAPQIVQNEEFIHHKSVMVAMSCYMLSQWVGLPKKDWMQVSLAGLLHDIGNVKVDPAVLYKPDSLSLNELEEMRRHTVLGYQLLKNVTAINEGVKLAALQHHERIDGSGYPLGVAADKIHPYAKIVAICDIFNAMTMKRAYRKAASPYLVLEQIQKDSFGKLDPAFVQTFIEKATQFHNGTIVRLSDDRIGEIVFSDRNHPTRPWVSVTGAIVNLTTERHLYIEEIMVRGGA